MNKLINKNIIKNKLFIINLIKIHLKLNIKKNGIEIILNIIKIKLNFVLNEFILIWFKKFNFNNFIILINIIFIIKYINKNIIHIFILKFIIIIIQKKLLIEILNIKFFKLFILNNINDIIIIINK